MKVYTLKKCKFTVEVLKDVVDNLPDPTPDTADDVRALWGLFMQHGHTSDESVVTVRLSDQFIAKMSIEDHVVE